MGIAIVTGANRGIGLELVRQLKERGADVVGICRTRSHELEKLNIRVESGLDLTAPASWSAIADIFKHDDIDLLIQNAGIASIESKHSLDLDVVNTQFATNAAAPLCVRSERHSDQTMYAKLN